MNREDLIHSIKNDDSIDIIIGYYKNDLEKINIIKELAILRIKLEEYGYSIINLDLICDINKLLEYIEIKDFRKLLKTLRGKLIDFYENF